MMIDQDYEVLKSLEKIIQKPIPFKDYNLPIKYYSEFGFHAKNGKIEVLHSNLKKLLEFIQKEYDDSDSDRRRKLLLVAILEILKNTVDNICMMKFSKEIIYQLIKRTESLSRDIVEDF